MQSEKKVTPYVALACFAGAMGGLLFGFDLIVISGAITDLTEFYHLNLAGKGWAASCALIGCMIGAALAGKISDAIGRKPVLIGTAILFTISAVGSGWAEKMALIPSVGGFLWFVFYRGIGGCAMGAAAGVAPIYIAEVGPARYRGALVTFYQLAIVLGVIAAQVSNYGIAVHVPQDQWRWMFTAEALPAVLFLLILLAVPESPRWLVKRDRSSLALKILCKTEGDETFARDELTSIQESLARERVGTRERRGAILDLFRPEMRRLMLIGLVFGIGSQFTGMTAVLTYAPDIFGEIGGKFANPLFQAVLLGFVNFACTFIPICLVDRVGRKKILHVGLAVMAVTLTLLSVLSGSSSPNGHVILILLLTCIGAYAASMASMTWVILAEIFPNRIRGVAMSAANLSLWFSAYLTTQFFPVFCGAFGLHVMFAVFAVVCVLINVFVACFVPETKGRSLEEIEILLVGSRRGKRSMDRK